MKTQTDFDNIKKYLERKLASVQRDAANTNSPVDMAYNGGRSRVLYEMLDDLLEGRL